MAYFKIGNMDYSTYVNSLSITTKHNYKAATNAAGNTFVRHVNSKRVIEVGIIPLDASSAAGLLSAVSDFKVSISFLDPETNELAENVTCVIPHHAVHYYTIQAGNVRTKAFSLQFTEL